MAPRRVEIQFVAESSKYRFDVELLTTSPQDQFPNLAVELFLAILDILLIVLVLDIVKKERFYSDTLATRRIKFGLRPISYQPEGHQLDMEHYRALIE